MRRGRIITWTIMLVASVLFAAPGLAATPAEIAQDLRDGDLSGSYTQAELQAYLQSAVAQGYGNPVETPVTPAAAVTPAAPVTAATPAAVESGVAGVASPVVTPAAAASPAAAPAARTAPTAGVAGVQKTAEQPLAATRQVGTLPFTGLDLALLVVGGMLLLLLGFGARRLGRQRA